jgi:hypothetical protein
MSTFYVSTTGNDTTGDGSLGNAYLTLSKAESVASDGDSVILGAGIFQAATYHTFTKALAWIGAGNDSTFLRGNNATRVAYLNSNKTKTFSNLCIDGLSSGTAPAYHVEGSGVDQQTTFTNCKFKNGKTTVLRLNSNMRGVVLSGCTIDANTETQIIHILGGISGFELRDSVINVPLGLTMNGVIYQGGAATSGTFIIDGNSISVLSNYSPIRLILGGFTGGQIRDNTITVGDNNTRTIIDLVDMVDTCIVTGNTLNIPSVQTSTLPIKCTSTVGTGSNCIYTIEDNVIFSKNADNYGILLGDEGGDITSKAGAFNGSSIKRNRLNFAPYYGLAIGSVHGIMMGGNKNIFFENNYVYGAAYAAACKGYGEAWTDGYIRNNVFVNCTYPVRMKGQSSIRCVNNVIYNDGSMNGTSLAITENGVGQDSDDALLRNNLVIRDADKVYEFQDTSFSTLDSDYQGFYLTGTATMGTKFPATSYSTLAEWQAGTSDDINSISGNPLIKSDYTIDAASPFFENGVPVKGVTDIVDISGINLITLGGLSTFSLNSPYNKRVPL